MPRLSKVLICAVVLILVSTVAALLYFFSLRIQNIGRIRTVGIQCSKESIDWGLILLDENKSVSADITNNGTVPVSLNLTTENWDPENATDFLRCGWSLEQTVLQTNTTVSAIIWLYVFPNCTGISSFTFDIILTGVEIEL